MSGIDACLKIAKLTAAAGEMTPFPFIKGAAQYNEFRQPRKTSWQQIRTMTMTQLTLSDVHNDITTGFSTLTGSMEASERNITSIKNNIEEIRTLGVQQRGLYKGVIWDIIPGNIHVIQRVTHSLRSCHCTGSTYKDSYCTVENSNTVKIIREYQAQGNNGGDTMDLGQLDHAINFFMKQRHPNLPQIFGVCRSPDFPAIIFHGTTQIPLNQYLHDLPATQFIPFFSELFQDLQSVSEVLPMENYRHLASFNYYTVFITHNEEEVYVNKYGKPVFGDLLCYTYYHLGPFSLSCTQEDGKYSLCWDASRASDRLFHSQASRWKSSSSLQKGDLQNCYEVIIYFHRSSLAIGNNVLWTQTFNQHGFQSPQYGLNGLSNPTYHCLDPKDFYAPGSILCNLQDLFSLHQVLVGRVLPPLHGWKWDIYLPKLQGPSGKEEMAEIIDLSFDNGLVSIELSWDDVIRTHIIRIQMPSEHSDAIVKSWIAQTSKLDSCLHSRGYGDDLQAYIIKEMVFYIKTLPKDGIHGDFCHICNAKDQYHHALSLSITAPIIDYDTNIFKSWPIVSCSQVCGMDLLKEEDIFTVKVEQYEEQIEWGSLLSMVHSTIPELNAEHGFDPTCNGIDVCKYFGWPLLETLDSSTGEWMLNGATSQFLRPVPIISDNMPGQILSQEHDSAPNSMDVVTGSIKEILAGEAVTKMESVSIVQHDISIRALIIILIAISVHISTIIYQLVMGHLIQVAEPSPIERAGQWCRGVQLNYLWGQSKILKVLSDQDTIQFRFFLEALLNLDFCSNGNTQNSERSREICLQSQ
ncbi:hypothetical protein IW262DRAFT_1508642 [Armillaria fumosa]|nr:hypothetical protein IW262DRAFT_1508642 [Armillaria fumosa]